MKRTIIAALIISLLASSFALADPPAWARHGREGDHHEWRHEDHHRRDRGGDRGRWRRYGHRRYRGDDRRRYDDRGEYRGWEHFDADRYRPPPGYYYRIWARGERLPIAYRARQYIVPDWTVYHLAPPPPGYCWVRVDNRAVLAAIATGVILEVVNGAFH
jgi:Ni/Co efflux regulator RcnB